MKAGNDLFGKAWLFLYAAAGENIGFEIRKKTDSSGNKEEKTIVNAGDKM